MRRDSCSRCYAYGRFLFEQAIRRRRTGTAPTVRYYCLDRAELEKTPESLFGNGTCAYAGKVNPAW